jgi:deoxyadenosine/deoxycytidine kinase
MRAFLTTSEPRSSPDLNDGRDVLVVVTGNDGVGKTTLVSLLAEQLDALVLDEPFEDNPFGHDYLIDPGTWTYQAEVEFIRRRANGLRKALPLGRPIVCDRWLSDDVEVFAELWRELGVLQDREVHSLRDLAADLVVDLPMPTHTVWMRASLDCMVSRISDRGYYPKALTLREITALREKHYARWLTDCDVFAEVDTTDMTLASLTGVAKRLADQIDQV